MKDQVIRINQTGIRCLFENGQYYLFLEDLCKALRLNRLLEEMRMDTDPFPPGFLVVPEKINGKLNKRDSSLLYLPLVYVGSWLRDLWHDAGSRTEKKRYEACYKAITGALIEDTSRIILN